MDLEHFLAEWNNDNPCVLVHTSGSTGKPKPLWVEKRRMEASAKITCDFLGLHEGDTALLCMPLDYIAGKMMVVRSLVRRLRLISVEPSGGPLDTVTEPLDFAAMVPLQVWNCLQKPIMRQRLISIRHLIIGGGAIDDSMATELRTFPNAVWSTYGMTETLSHIALRRLSGPEASEWYTPFEGVQLSQDADGCLIINAPAVHDGPLVTNDIVETHPLPLFNQADEKDCSGVPSCNQEHQAKQFSFRILGRRDNIICSGGLKIQAEEVERLLRPHMRVPYLITKRPDEKFGEAVVLLTEGETDAALAICKQVLPRYWQPRAYIHIDHIPMTATGKPARHEARVGLCSHEPSPTGQ